jgi:hypothetical protein
MRSATFLPTPGARATMAMSRSATALARSEGDSVDSTASETLAPTPCTPCKQPEPLALKMRAEAVEPDHVLAHIGLDEERGRLARAAQRGKRPGRAVGDIADPADIDDAVVLADLVDDALEFADHGWVSGEMISSEGKCAR